jgi:3'-phosphoadenosine 5'-phosphosulfate sulfotransferase (PAPS reductase)/FAD synthetase
MGDVSLEGDALDYLKGRTVVASVSGGKDSAAMCLHLQHDLGLKIERVFMDTGWEHDETYRYIEGPLQDALGPITMLKAPKLMEELILHKGMFPSRVRRFCTQELKVKPLYAYLNQRMQQSDVVNAVGIRRAESAARSQMSEWEWSEGLDAEVWRPLIHWSEQDVIDIHHRHGLAPNPLYLRGATRVGCWPCIFARKSEIRLVADTDPGRIDRIRSLEERVWQIQQKRNPEYTRQPAFFGMWQHGQGTRACEPIDKVVEWSRTAHGGKVYEDAPDMAQEGCMRWGLCETSPEEKAT